MTRAQSASIDVFKTQVPKSMRPLLGRAMRSWRQMRGLPTAKSRKGVVLMLHVGRCGSTVLGNLLAQHPGMYWDGKLHRKFRGLYRDRSRDIDYVSWTRRQFSISGANFYGFEFKILPDQYPALLHTTAAEFLSACKTLGVTHYVVLKRRNTLKHVISHYVSKARGSWHFTGADKVTRKTIQLDLAKVSTGSSPGVPLIDYLKEVDAAYDQIVEAIPKEQVLVVEYESDIELGGGAQAYAKVCDFIGVTPLKVAAKYTRANPYPIHETVSNYAELEAALQGTDYEWMLELEASDH